MTLTDVNISVRSSPPSVLDGFYPSCIHYIILSCRVQDTREDLKCSERKMQPASTFDVFPIFIINTLASSSGLFLILPPPFESPQRITIDAVGGLTLSDVPFHSPIDPDRSTICCKKHWQKRCKDTQRYFCNFLSSFRIRLVYDIV